MYFRTDMLTRMELETVEFARVDDTEYSFFTSSQKFGLFFKAESPVRSMNDSFATSGMFLI